MMAKQVQALIESVCASLRDRQTVKQTDKQRTGSDEEEFAWLHNETRLFFS